MEKAIILDRDGTLIRERGDYNYLPEHVRILDDVIAPMHRFRNAGYFFFVVTNQSGIAKNIYGHKEVEAIHSMLHEHFENAGILIKCWLYCPHHPDYSLCLCRKPGSLLPEKLIGAYRLSPELCWFIGDAKRDISAGKSAGMNTFSIKPNEGLQRAAEYILGDEVTE